MNPARKWVRDVFGFSGPEINGFLILIPLMMLLIFSEPLYHSWLANREQHYFNDARILDSLVSSWPVQASPSEGAVIQEVSLFTFDPQTASIAELRRLGFSETLAKRMAAYRQKGGVFTTKSDLLKIYGLDSSLYKRLHPYIRLTPAPVTGRKSGKARGAVGKRVDTTFNINTADTIVLKTVYGIGSTLAARIVKFRNALGGFVSADQLYEVYGLDSVVVQRLLNVGYIDPAFTPTQLNINTADERQLSSHPYIGKKIARVLVSYRFHHGHFKDISDIEKLSVVGAEEGKRMMPYIKIKD